LDFQLNDEQLHLKRSVREFAEREILPHVMKWDEAGEFPLCTIQELGKLGLLGIIFPVEYGGAGMGYVEYITAIEELSRRTPRCAPITFFWPGTRRRRRSTSRSSPPENTSALGG
jgi:alkylation response protein AidB-like acyl-CoA dehydrogenase